MRRARRVAGETGEVLRGGKVGRGHDHGLLGHAGDAPRDGLLRAGLEEAEAGRDAPRRRVGCIVWGQAGVRLEIADALGDHQTLKALLL